MRQTTTPRKTTTRKIFKLTFFSFNPAIPSEVRYFEVRDLAAAIRTKNELANGRPYFSLEEVKEITR